MIRPNEVAQAQVIATAINDFSATQTPLKGVVGAANLSAFTEQLIESIRRVRFAETLRAMPLADYCADVSRDSFDPFRAALVHSRHGDLDEACWLIFLSVHFGKNRKDGWRLMRDIYAGAGGNDIWTWHRTSADPQTFGEWAKLAHADFAKDNVYRRFGNHRKYETLKPTSNRSTANVVASYVAWVGNNRGHQGLINDGISAVGNDPKALFDHLFKDMSKVISFGRTGKFDYLTMIGKLALLPIAPGSPYLEGATGPLHGARLFIDGSTASSSGAAALEPIVIAVGNVLGVGMQEMEDSLCNWQKNPSKFVPFRG